MKKIFLSLISALFIFVNTMALADEIYIENNQLKLPEIKAESAMLIDMKTGKVVYSKNPDKRLYPASTTKIMTGILALENGNLTDIVTVDAESLKPITNDDSHMGLLVGEEITMEQLINSMLVHSANDASNVIATHISGNSKVFVDLMNQKAQALGAKNTNFVNTYGIHNDNHYTTASDLAIMARYAMKNEKFREIIKKSAFTIPATNKYNEERVLPATNMMLRATEYKYDLINGIKTGHTSKAGYCLVSSAQKDGTELLCVVMKCETIDDCYTTTRGLLDYGFDNYKSIVMATKGDTVISSNVVEAKGGVDVMLTVSDSVYAFLSADSDVNDIESVTDIPKKIKAPVKKGDIIGTISYSFNGEIIENRELVALNDVERNIFVFIFNRFINILVICLIIAIILVILLLVIGIINNKRYRSQKRLNNLYKSNIRPQSRNDIFKR